MSSCRHTALYFGSGALHVLCRGCGAQWTAVLPTGEVAYSRHKEPLSGEERLERKEAERRVIEEVDIGGNPILDDGSIS